MMMLPLWEDCPVAPLPIQNLLRQHNWNQALTVANADDDDLEKAIVRISAGFETGEDVCCDRWFDGFNGFIHSIHWNIRNYRNWHEG